MIHGNQSKRPPELIPPARHRHTAVVFDHGIWVYGGMTDLQERSDLWRFDLSKTEETYVIYSSTELFHVQSVKGGAL